MATTFVDGTTPLDAAAMNGIEDEIADLESSVNTKLSNRFSLNYASYTNINDETDLNNITSPGVYVCTSSSSAKAMDNCPIGLAFVLIVMNTIANYNWMQFIFGYSTSAAYWRTRYGTTAAIWYDWKAL